MAHQLVRRFISAAVAVFIVGAALPAFAQNGSLRGKVVDQAGQPVDRAEVVLDFVGDLTQQYRVYTNKAGEWVKAGMIARPGTWTVTVTKEKLVGKLAGVRVAIGQMTKIADITIAPPAAASTTKAPSGMSSEEVAKRNKRQEELAKLFDATNAAIDAGNLDEAITKLNAIIAEVEKCAACHAKLGDIQLKKGDKAAAEAAYLKSIEIDPNQAGPYGALATIYNEQRKFDEATKMSTKAAELQSAAGGSTDPSTAFNQGVIFWNQGKIPEAKAEWEKAVKLDPKMADAHYWLGMANLNQNKIPDAKTAFNEYLKLAPTGQYAETTKAILATIK
jgi:tetratricopeptide (TPR) repeat protein